MKELEQAILDLITKVYCVKYTGKLKVIKLKDGYDLVLALNKEERPIHIAAQLDWDNFLVYVEKELRSRHLHSTEFYTAIQLYPNENPPITSNPTITDIVVPSTPEEKTTSHSYKEVISVDSDEEVVRTIEQILLQIGSDAKDWVGTREQYDKLEKKYDNINYIIIERK